MPICSSASVAFASGHLVLMLTAIGRLARASKSVWLTVQRGLVRRRDLMASVASCRLGCADVGDAFRILPKSSTRRGSSARQKSTFPPLPAVARGRYSFTIRAAALGEEVALARTEEARATSRRTTE